MNNNLQVKIKYLSDLIPKLEKISIGDWIDLSASKTVTIYEGENLIIPLGIATELPEGYEAHLVPRSSTFKKFGLLMVNSPGIIDNSYRGEWGMFVYATKKTTVNAGDRICQFRLVKNQPEVIFVEVNELNDTERGAGGFGSTGIQNERLDV